MSRSRFTDSQIMAVLKRAEVGEAVPELCRETGISTSPLEATRKLSRDPSMVALQWMDRADA